MACPGQTLIFLYVWTWCLCYIARPVWWEPVSWWWSVHHDPLISFRPLLRYHLSREHFSGTLLNMVSTPYTLLQYPLSSSLLFLCSTLTISHTVYFSCFAYDWLSPFLMPKFHDRRVLSVCLFCFVFFFNNLYSLLCLQQLECT